jgi:hypothetical protein
LLNYLTNSDYDFGYKDDKMYFDYGLFVFTKENAAVQDTQSGEKEGLFDFSEVYFKHWNEDKVNATIGINWAEASTDS